MKKETILKVFVGVIIGAFLLNMVAIPLMRGSSVSNQGEQASITGSVQFVSNVTLIDFSDELYVYSTTNLTNYTLNLQNEGEIHSFQDNVDVLIVKLNDPTDKGDIVNKYILEDSQVRLFVKANGKLPSQINGTNTNDLVIDQVSVSALFKLNDEVPFGIKAAYTDNDLNSIQGYAYYPLFINYNPEIKVINVTRSTLEINVIELPSQSLIDEVSNYTSSDINWLELPSGYRTEMIIDNDIDLVRLKEILNTELNDDDFVIIQSVKFEIIPSISDDVHYPMQMVYNIDNGNYYVLDEVLSANVTVEVVNGEITQIKQFELN